MTAIQPEQQTGARGILANAGWLYLDQAVRAVVTLVVFGLMTRSLGPEGIGRLSYAQAFAGFLLPLALLGLDYVVIHEFVARRAATARIFGTAFRLKAGAAVLAAGLGWLSAWWFLPADDPAMRLVNIALLGLLFQPFLTADLFFQSRVAARFPAMARMSACLFANGLRLWFLHRNAPLAWFVWIWVGEFALNAVALRLALRIGATDGEVAWGAWDGAVARRLLAAAWPLALADVAIAGYLKFDQLLLTHLAGPETLGRYAAGIRLADALEFFLLAVINSYFPRIIAARQGERAAFEKRTMRFLGLMTWSAIAIAVGVTVAGPWLVPLALGPQFAGTAPVLTLLAWGNVFATQIAVRGKWYLADGLQTFILVSFTAGMVVHLGLLWFLAPRYGALGAASGYLTAQAVMALVTPWWAQKTRFAGRLPWRSLAVRDLLS
jgi:O-antigen/teichoic acid export membrane protein